MTARDVASRIQGRGSRCFEQGQVNIVDADDRQVVASVRDPLAHRVKLWLDDDTHTLRVACDCDHLTKRFEACQHIWGALLAAEDQGYLTHEFEADDTHEDDEVWIEVADPATLEELFHEEHPAAPASGKQPKPAWQLSLEAISTQVEKLHTNHNSPLDQTQILYLIDKRAVAEGDLVIELRQRKKRRDGSWGSLRNWRLEQDDPALLPDPEDRQIIAMLTGCDTANANNRTFLDNEPQTGPQRFVVPPSLHRVWLERICATKRCLLDEIGPGVSNLKNLEWDTEEPWQLWLGVTKAENSNLYLIRSEFRRASDSLEISKDLMLTSGGVMLQNNIAVPYEPIAGWVWLNHLRRDEEWKVPTGQIDRWLETAVNITDVPNLDLPEELQFERVVGMPRPRLYIRKPQDSASPEADLTVEITFGYEGSILHINEKRTSVFHAAERRLILRDFEAEHRAAEDIHKLGFKTYPEEYEDPRATHTISPKQLDQSVHVLSERGWWVEAEGRLYRQAGDVLINVKSNVDWFELKGTVDFEGQTATIPDLLRAVRQGDRAVLLDDGTYGMLPTEWLNKYGMLAALGQEDGDVLKFANNQVGLLDVLLAAQDNVNVDARFQAAREKLHAFEGVKPEEPVTTFEGELRGYQKLGLGWMRFLREFNFGGCLADDMGLGKTVQVLALLDHRRKEIVEAKQDRVPSLVVVPKSLVYNWAAESKRFTPELKVLNHTGPERGKTIDAFDGYDLVITTYGTMRRDIAMLHEAKFDYVILDEAQAIKNARTASAKSARLLNGQHRLALSGTPIENHLGELWSLFEFLNPGMLGAARAFQKNLTTQSNEVQTEQPQQALAAAVRPFILRRTKDQVAKDLPPRIEQTIYCELDTEQRQLYDQLRDHYRKSILSSVDREGMNQTRFQVLEALLRLRQTACHPGLMDQSRKRDASAKLDMLIPQLTEVASEGHKALVFSQFTSFLALVREQLDAEGVTYEYLDGRTRDRAKRIERFQNDPDCPLFLISLKAGGLGLNLTAAEYVFLLDPWWNPAVEAQAIDRAHRIGQTQQVFAYRLIARDTVEEKVLELQQSKRDLADQIINADNSLIKNMTREDLENLLS